MLFKFDVFEYLRCCRRYRFLSSQPFGLQLKLRPVSYNYVMPRPIMVLYDIGVNGIGQGRQKGQRLIDDLREDETVLGVRHKINAFLRCPIQ